MLQPINWINLLADRGIAYPSILDDGNTVEWLDYLQRIGKDGSNFVYEWGDKSGNGNDLLQATGTNQPLWSADGVLFDGVDNFIKAVAFTLIQPEFIYIVFKQVTYTSPNSIFDGDSTSSMSLYQNLNTPEIRQYAGSIGDVNNNLALNTFGIARVLFNGASSKLIINETAPVVSDTGAFNAGGFTLGGRGAGDIRFTNIQVKEVIIRKVADTAPNEQIIYDYLSSKYGI